MNYYYIIIVITTFSILPAALIGLIRFREIFPAYQPFVYIAALSFLNELVGSFMVHQGKSNALCANIYILLHGLLWIWQFRKWNISDRNKPLFLILSISLGIVWLIEQVIMGKIFIFSSIYRICYSSALVFLAINQINKLIMIERKNLLRNAMFLICIGAMIFFTYKILIESFYVQQIDQSQSFFAHLYSIMIFVNLFVNLLYAMAMLWIPTRQKFSLPY